MSKLSTPSGATLFSPLARTVMDRFHEAVILFDGDGQLSYANRPGREALEIVAGENGLRSRSLLQKLGRLGARVERLEMGEVVLGHAVYLSKPTTQTLAEQERRAIVETLHATGWRLTETARRLGISRTTLWRRLRRYGVRTREGATE